MKYRLKTKKSILKRIKIKRNFLMHKKAFKQHLLRKKSSKRLRFLSAQSMINKSDIKSIKKLLPYR